MGRPASHTQGLGRCGQRLAMLAAWYDRPGPRRRCSRVGEMDDPDPGPGEVRVRQRDPQPAAEVRSRIDDGRGRNHRGATGRQEGADVDLARQPRLRVGMAAQRCPS